MIGSDAVEYPVTGRRADLFCLVLPKPLVTPEDLLAAKVADVTEEAAAKGVEAGMSGADALAKPA